MTEDINQLKKKNNESNVSNDEEDHSVDDDVSINNDNKKSEKKKGYEKIIEEIKEENRNSYISKISEPILKKKYLKNVLKILDYIYYAKLNSSQILKTNNSLDEEKQKLLKKKLIVIGLTQVIKCIRKGYNGIVLIAIDVFPINIICHLPSFCEQYKIPYTFVTTKNKLAHLCKLKRSITCLFILKPDIHISTFEHTINEYNPKKKIHNYQKLYDKLISGVKKNHPFFQS
ncbi:60S ribosomal protein L7ae/L30e, putative [Plasmodium sp. gorilla clade G2]|uniref:60S ribosomal protein L7ae/L30e, putative n=1 Tax=Plasmodium sp. gorilla clade G2 TaxID=880535 RepID=UPI000D224300|nr:60S ribosomal protein L7ae/L30e, putative [Plasmodium sp. gorilla clade G2]SOV11491.1 60S ribosomal protein L7ae/L30e, putative [Plasmodium sp. gorilla clade G2]